MAALDAPAGIREPVPRRSLDFGSWRAGLLENTWGGHIREGNMSEVVDGVSDWDGCGDRGWLMPVADEFVTRIGGGRDVGGRSGNLRQR